MELEQMTEEEAYKLGLEALTYEEQVAAENELEQKVMNILKSHGIRMNIGGCGCCGSPSVAFEYKGELIVGKRDKDGDIAEEDYFKLWMID